MLARDWRFVLELFSFEANPANTYLPHIFFCDSACAFGFEGGELSHLFTCVGPGQAREFGARIIGTFRVLHHLPKPFEAGVAFAAKVERCSSKIRKESKFVAFGKNHFAWASFLGQNFPRRGSFFGDGRPPMRWVVMRPTRGAT